MVWPYYDIRKKGREEACWLLDRILSVPSPDREEEEEEEEACLVGGMDVE